MNSNHTCSYLSLLLPPSTLPHPPLLHAPKPRAYPTRKISENVQCEIFQTILDEAREAYAANIIHELVNNIPEDVEKNTRLIELFVKEWLSKRCTR